MPAACGWWNFLSVCPACGQCHRVAFEVQRAQTEGACPMQVLIFLLFLHGYAYAREEGQRVTQSPPGARILVKYTTILKVLIAETWAFIFFAENRIQEAEAG